MLAYIDGVIVRKDSHALVVVAGGIGFRVFVLAHSLSASVGDRVQMHLHHSISENQQSLYGFSDEHVFRVFEVLLEIHGVGPKTALGILEKASVEHLAQAVQQKDPNFLHRVSGLGKKTAEKIVSELSGRDDLPFASFGNISAHDDSAVVEALVGLGYSAQEASTALQNVSDDELSVEGKIAATLQFLGRQK